MTADDWKGFIYEDVHEGDRTKLGGVEFRLEKKEDTGADEDKLFIWVPPSWIEYFTDDLLDESHFDDGGIECRIVSRGYVFVDITPILGWDGIEVKDVLKEEDYDR